jgi:hypothetical protein
MFRRLAEAFQDSGNNGSHQEYINNQNTYFNTLPNMILSGTSGLKGFDVAIQSVDSQGKGYLSPPVKNPNNIFISDSSSKLNTQAQQCSSSSIDQLLAIKNPNADIGCGWLYTPPNQGSPYPVISQGFIGDANGPLKALNPPDSKKWFFDLQLAKKQILLDKCKALKACNGVDSEVFNGVCGYCTDTNQGVPVDNVGQPLYSGDTLGSCSPGSIITDSKSCPIPSTSGGGPQPIVDKTCDPINGRLSAACLYNQVLSGGCSDNGTLAAALSGTPSPDDYISNLNNADVVKIYNRVANPPLNLDIFRKGATTVDVVLKEVRQLAGNAKLASNSAIGAAARDLCLQKGAINNYNFCLDLPDTTPPPFDITCLQQLFLKMGGQPAGTAYPSNSSIINYNTMMNLSAVKQYLNTLSQNMNSSDYNTQRDAMIQFLGISPEKLISRAPYNQGVEVIWLYTKPGHPNQIWGILKRTIEKDIVQYPPGTTTAISQLASSFPGLSNYVGTMQMFDIRAPSNFTAKFIVTVDDAFFLAVNQPANIASTAFGSSSIDQVGLFSNMGIQGTTTYSSNNCSNCFADTPNITKLFHSDAGGGQRALQLAVIACSGTQTFQPQYYSLTCEPRAPFLNFEVNQDGNVFDDTRNPGLFSGLISTTAVEFHNRPEEKNSVPGNKGFVRFTNNSTIINITNVTYQSWGTVTFAFRLQSMPVKDAIFSFWVYNKYCVLYLQPINGSSAQIRIHTSMTQNNTIYDGPTNFNLQLGAWYYLQVTQNGLGFDINCDSINNIIKNGNFTTNYTKVISSGPITTTINNGLYLQGKYSCNIAVGGKLSGLNFYSSSFQFDLAWMHFYDYYITAADAVKDCQASWIFTQFPDSLNTYKVNN